jgi:hypothetical protein
MHAAKQVVCQPPCSIDPGLMKIITQNPSLRDRNSRETKTAEKRAEKPGTSRENDSSLKIKWYGEK